MKIQQVLTEESLSLIEGREPLIEGREPEEEDNQSEPATPYSVDDIIADGCFLERSRLEGMLQRLRKRKNLILQGPPGTGKTWLAKRLAFALVGRTVGAACEAIPVSSQPLLRGLRQGLASQRRTAASP